MGLIKFLERRNQVSSKWQKVHLHFYRFLGEAIWHLLMWIASADPDNGSCFPAIVSRYAEPRPGARTQT